MAVSKELQGLAITDHDTVGAYPEAYREAEHLGLSILTGVEFSSAHNGKTVHILGYGFDYQHSAISELCLWHHNRRSQRLEVLKKGLEDRGVSLTEEELQELRAHPCLGRVHFAQVLLKRGLVNGVGEAFKSYLNDSWVKEAEKKAGLCAKDVPSTIETIKKAKGKAILAHPHLLNKGVFPKIRDFDFDGVEAHYARFDRQHCQPFLEVAATKNWITTGGSDFHGLAKLNNMMGDSWVGRETFLQLGGQ